MFQSENYVVCYFFKFWLICRYDKFTNKNSTTTAAAVVKAITLFRKTEDNKPINYNLVRNKKNSFLFTPK